MEILKNTNVRAIFVIYGECFPIEEVTKILNINPSCTYKKGEILRAVPMKENCWKIETETIETFDAEEQLDKILKLLISKEKELLEIKRLYDVEFKFDTVIEVEDKDFNGVRLEPNFIQFAARIGAIIEYNMYIN